MKRKSMVVTDMTTGNPLRRILMFALPILIGNIFQHVYGVVDTMVAGYNLGDGAIAAIGATSSLYGLIFSLAWGINSGFALVVTRSFGGHDETRMRQAIAGTILLDCISALVLTALSLLILRPLMRALNTPDVIFEEAYSYIMLICAGMGATIAFNMFASLLRSVGNSVVPLFFLIVSSVVNIALDVLFIGVFHWGVSGAALATVLAQLLSAVLSGVYFLRNYRAFLPRRKDYHIPKDTLRELISSGFAMAFMYSVVELGTVFYQSATNALAEPFGEGIITAHTAARRLLDIFMTPLMTITDAGAVFIGQNYGAGKRERIREGLKKELILALIWSGLSIVILYLFGASIVRFTTGTRDATVLGNAVLSLRIHSPFLPVLTVLFALRTAMQAVGIKTTTVISSGIELGMKILAALWLIPLLGFIGTCITEPIIWMLCAAFLTAAYGYKRRRGGF
ncbi:MAG: MATE family efflux transporter [Clostridia bacterium]|nr:MATE family efflux transporter [Clostridia bacterium]